MRSFFPTSPKRRSWTILVRVALVAGAVLLGMAAESRAQDDITCLCRLALLTGSDPMTGGVEIRDWQSIHVYDSSPFEVTEFQLKNCASRCMEMAQKDAAFTDVAGLCKKLGHSFDGRRARGCRARLRCGPFSSP